MSSASKSRSKISRIEESAGTGPQREMRPDPGADASAVQTDLTAVMNAALSERWLRLVGQTEKARSKPTEKAVHDLRVAIRRMAALLDIIRTIMPNSGGVKIRKELKKHLKALSDLRDTQVQILQVGQLAPEFDILSGFLASLVTREASQMKRARKGIERMDIDTLQKHFDELKIKTDDFLAAPEASETSLAILKGMLARIYIRSVVLRNEIRNSSDHTKETGPRHSRNQKIHKLRLLFKRFRYSVEILQPMFPQISDAVLRKMSNYQSKMGAIQDTEVLMSAIGSHAKRARKKELKKNADQPDPFIPLHNRLMLKLNEECDAFLPSMDQFDKFWQRLNQSR